MLKSHAAKLARKLMDENGLEDVALTWNKGKHCLGYYLLGTISLSEPWVTNLPTEHVKYIILHEIAHALSSTDAEHGKEWQQVARKLGIASTRTASCIPEEITRDVVQKVAKYVAVCQKNPEHRTYFNRMGKHWANPNYYRCSVCGGDFEVTENDRS